MEVMSHVSGLHLEVLAWLAGGGQNVTVVEESVNRSSALLKNSSWEYFDKVSSIQTLQGLSIESLFLPGWYHLLTLYSKITSPKTYIVS